MNAYCERPLREVRRECPDHLLILGERHLRRGLEKYCFEYFADERDLHNRSL